jgi:hypothetical protein
MSLFLLIPGRQYVRNLNYGEGLAEEQVEDQCMAAFTTANFPISLSAEPVVSESARPNRRRRRITPRAGHALEILGHAIEYLTDEFLYESTNFSVDSSQLEAVQLLMALNREIYYECPEVPSFGERWRSILHFRAA